jgi:hypothetical protein
MVRRRAYLIAELEPGDRDGLPRCPTLALARREIEIRGQKFPAMIEKKPLYRKS